MAKKTLKSSKFWLPLVTEVEPEAGLVTLETDKATMDVPSPEAGVVKEVKVA